MILFLLTIVCLILERSICLQNFLTWAKEGDSYENRIKAA